MARIRAVLVLGLALMISQQRVSAAPISGDWLLDVEHSDDIRKLVTAGNSKHDKKKKKNNGKGHGHQAPPGQHGKAKPFPLMSAHSLQISADNDQVAITADQGKPLRLFTDGRAAPVSLSGWGSEANSPVRFSSWEGDTLVMESSFDEGTHITQSYSVNDRGMLVQTTEVRRANAEAIVVKRRFRTTEALPEQKLSGSNQSKPTATP